jgi:RNA polymerase sigma-70 factor (ECF subfamily)
LRLEEYCRKADNRVRNPEQFLLQTVRNLIVDEIRRERRVSYAPEPVEELDGPLAFIDPGPSPDRVLDAEQRLNEIKSALATVSKRARDVYLLHMAGYEYREIGNALGISVKTVEGHMTRAIFEMAKRGIPK